MNIAIIGPSYAGKTTCARQVAKEFGLMRFSLGRKIQHYITEQKALGLLARPYALRGNLVPDELGNAILEENIRKNTEVRGFVFDGFPCTLYQAVYMIDLLREAGMKLDGVVFMKMSPDMTFERAIKNPPKDELLPVTQESLATRVNSFKSTAESVLRLFAHSTAFMVVDGAGDPLEDAYPKIRQFIKDIEDGKFVSRSVEELDKEIDQFLAGYQMTEKTPTNKPMNLVLMGPPGCGKGTHSEMLCKMLQIPAVSTGNLFREHLKNKTALGAIAGAFISQGRLVPDDVTAAMVKKRVNDSDAMHGFILDGFPRTVPQANALDAILTVSSRALDGVIYINVPDAEIIQRLSGRRFCPKCQRTYHVIFNKPKKEGCCDYDGEALITRADDNEATVKARLEGYRKQTLPVIELYRQRGILVEVNGMGSVDEVEERMIQGCQSLIQHKYCE